MRRGEEGRTRGLNHIKKLRRYSDGEVREAPADGCQNSGESG